MENIVTTRLVPALAAVLVLGLLAAAAAEAATNTVRDPRFDTCHLATAGVQ